MKASYTQYLALLALIINNVLTNNSDEYECEEDITKCYSRCSEKQVQKECNKVKGCCWVRVNQEDNFDDTSESFCWDYKSIKKKWWQSIDHFKMQLTEDKAKNYKIPLTQYNFCNVFNLYDGNSQKWNNVRYNIDQCTCDYLADLSSNQMSFVKGFMIIVLIFILNVFLS